MGEEDRPAGSVPPQERLEASELGHNKAGCRLQGGVCTERVPIKKDGRVDELSCLQN